MAEFTPPPIPSGELPHDQWDQDQQDWYDDLYKALEWERAGARELPDDAAKRQHLLDQLVWWHWYDDPSRTQ